MAEEIQAGIELQLTSIFTAADSGPRLAGRRPTARVRGMSLSTRTLPYLRKWMSSITNVVVTFGSQIQRGFKFLQSALQSHQADPVEQLEDAPAGYPRFAKLMGSHTTFLICRRFSDLRVRLLLLKQDRISSLEEQLDRIDREERHPLFLGNSRRDRNEERKTVLVDIEVALADYDRFLMGLRNVLDYRQARGRDIASLEHWVEGTGSIARAETAFLRKRRDLVGIASSYGDVLSFLQTGLLQLVIPLFRGLRKIPHFSISRDPNVYIFSGPQLTRAIQSLIVCAIVIVLQLPVIIIVFVSNLALQLSIIVLASAVFIAALLGMTNAKTGEMFLAGATYAAVLVVFVAGNNHGPS